MSADKSADIELVEPKITIDDVKRRAEAVKDLAKSEAKRSANELMHERATQVVIVGVVAVATLASIAFYLGTRRGASKVSPTLPPYHCFPPE